MNRFVRCGGAAATGSSFWWRQNRGLSYYFCRGLKASHGTYEVPWADPVADTPRLSLGKGNGAFGEEQGRRYRVHGLAEEDGTLCAVVDAARRSKAWVGAGRVLLVSAGGGLLLLKQRWSG